MLNPKVSETPRKMSIAGKHVSEDVSEVQKTRADTAIVLISTSVVINQDKFLQRLHPDEIWEEMFFKVSLNFGFIEREFSLFLVLASDSLSYVMSTVNSTQFLHQLHSK